MPLIAQLVRVREARDQAALETAVLNAGPFTPATRQAARNDIAARVVVCRTAEERVRNYLWLAALDFGLPHHGENWKNVILALQAGLQGGTEDTLADTFMMAWPLAANFARRERGDPEGASIVSLNLCCQAIEVVMDGATDARRKGLLQVAHDAFQLLGNVEWTFLMEGSQALKRYLPERMKRAQALDNATQGALGLVKWLQDESA